MAVLDSLLVVFAVETSRIGAEQLLPTWLPDFSTPGRFPNQSSIPGDTITSADVSAIELPLSFK
ncbi:MAG: hypothetical protein ACRD9S_04905 [Pyrinomonadaceae bacterium]